MSSDPVAMALKAALTVEESSELRLALSKRLLELNQPKEALCELERVLSVAPAHLDALELAACAANATNDLARAQAYRLALAAHRRPAERQSRDVPAPPVPIEAIQNATPPRSHQDAASNAAPPHLRLVVPEDAEEPESAPVTFAQVGGLEDVKQRLNRSFLLPLKQPQLFAKFGKSMRGGLLLYGPPGCGKTFIARALAGEIGARFVAVGLSDVLDMWLGESERKLHELFENARRRAPTVLFFDEVDAIGQRRTQLKHSAGRNVVNQFLSELDGVGSQNRDVFVLGATNHPWDMDPALRRPGRFDRMVFVPAPDRVARERILRLKLEGRPTSSCLDLRWLADNSAAFSGADLQAVVDGATELAFEQSIQVGSALPIDDAMLKKALRDVRPSTRPWLETARNYAIYANEGGVYDDLLAYLKSLGLG